MVTISKIIQELFEIKKSEYSEYSEQLVNQPPQKIN